MRLSAGPLILHAARDMLHTSGLDLGSSKRLSHADRVLGLYQGVLPLWRVAIAT